MPHFIIFDGVDGESVRKDSGDAHLDYLTITMTDTTGTDSFDFKATDDGETEGLLLPAVQAAREAARAGEEDADPVYRGATDGGGTAGDADLDGSVETADFLMLG